MSHAVIGMFNDAAAATSARSELLATGVSAADIRMTGTDATTSSLSSGAAADHEPKGFWESVKEMFGAENATSADAHLKNYAEGVRRGSVVLRVDSEEDQADRVVEILQSNGAVDVDAMASQWKGNGWTGSGVETATGATEATNANISETTAASTVALSDATERLTAATSHRAGDISHAGGKIDLVKEDLAVGKRVVNRGGVRIIKRVIERPVEQDVQLREEHVSVDRNVVDRPLAGSDLDSAFKDQTIELSETAEEAVTAKTARIVGEVVVGKNATERTEKVRDTLRETDVQVEQLPGTSTGSSSKSVEDVGRSDAARSAKTGV